MKSMHRHAYTGASILIMDFIIINYILAEFIFKEKRLNKTSENKFSSKMTCYTVFVKVCQGECYYTDELKYEEQSIKRATSLVWWLICQK